MFCIYIIDKHQKLFIIRLLIKWRDKRREKKTRGWCEILITRGKLNKTTFTNDNSYQKMCNLCHHKKSELFKKFNKHLRK